MRRLRSQHHLIPGRPPVEPEALLRQIIASTVQPVSAPCPLAIGGRTGTCVMTVVEDNMRVSSMRHLLKRWPQPYVPDREYIGPARSRPCPCGSSKPARSCHVSVLGRRWTSSPTPPAITGKRTGRSVSGCYAEASNDCGGKLSREHWISNAIYQKVLERTGRIRIEGLAWLPGEAKELPVAALASRILCERHNNRLTELDDQAGHLFRILWEYQDAIAREPRGLHLFSLFDGPTVERWLLKTFWGAAASGTISSATGAVVRSIDSKADNEALAEILFRNAPWTGTGGLHVRFVPAHPVCPQGTFALNPIVSNNAQLIGFGVEIGAASFQISIGHPISRSAERVLLRPEAIVIRDPARDVELFLALGWPNGLGGPPLFLNYGGRGPGGIPSGSPGESQFFYPHSGFARP